MSTRTNKMTCAVATCKPSEQGSKHHYFPQDKVSQKKWIFQCQRKDAFQVNTATICSKHFSEDAYERDLCAELTGRPPPKKVKEGCRSNTFSTKISSSVLLSHSKVSYVILCVGSRYT